MPRKINFLRKADAPPEPSPPPSCSVCGANAPHGYGKEGWPYLRSDKVKDADARQWFCREHRPEGSVSQARSAFQP